MGVLYEIVTGSKMDTAKIIHDSMDESNMDQQKAKQEDLSSIETNNSGRMQGRVICG